MLIPESEYDQNPVNLSALREKYIVPYKFGDAAKYPSRTFHYRRHILEKYNITVAIPHYGPVELLKMVIDLHQLQTIKPYIVIVDTGSPEPDLSRVRALRCENVEVHEIAMHDTPHPSDFVAIAMDLAFSMCKTDYMFTTHSDCLPRRRDLLEWQLGLCDSDNPVVGYEMSEREGFDVSGFFSHTASMFHIPTMDRIGFGWSQRRLINCYNPPVDKEIKCGGWPDTEVLGNYILRDKGIKPLLIGGPETNYERWVDDNVDHIRSFTSSYLYAPDYHRRAQQGYENAVSEALERIADWSS